MKKIYLILFAILFSFTSNAQNIGVGTATPVQKLDVNGAIKIGSSTNNQPGSIRYNGGAFEGGNGTSWKPFEDLPSRSIIIAQSTDTTSIKAAGFSVLKKMDIWDTVNIHIGTDYPGSWTVGFPLSTTGVNTPTPSSAESVLYGKNFIYLGQDAYLYQYDISAETWTKLPNICPLGVRNNPGVTLVGTNIYITGGWKYSGGFIFYNDAAKYNLLTNTWTGIANIPVTSAYHATTAIGTDLYLLDGYNTSDFTIVKKMYKYNTLTNTWSADLSTTTSPPFLTSGNLVAYNNKLVWHNGRQKIYAYDLVAGTNTDLNPSTPLASTYDFGVSLLSVTSDKIYLAGNNVDTTTLDPSTEYNIPVQYELDIPSGKLIKLNVCQLTPQVNCYQFNEGNNKAYSLGFGTNSSFLFDRNGSEKCDVVLKRKGYWYYMKKN